MTGKDVLLQDEEDDIPDLEANDGKEDKQHDRGVKHCHGVTFPSAAVVAPKWRETPEELRRSLNFDTAEDEDSYGNKERFANSCDKVHAVVDNETGEFQACAHMSECDVAVHWNMKLKGKKMYAMVFEGKNSLIDHTDKIKASKAALDPSVSCQP
jgi:hypothetical protein